MDYVLHEVLEVQEMAAFKSNCLTKSIYCNQGVGHKMRKNKINYSYE